MIKDSLNILCINGADSIRKSGIQSDITTVSALGAEVVAVVSCIAGSGSTTHDIPADIIIKEVETAYAAYLPKAVKVGFINDAETIRMLGNEMLGRRGFILAPGIFSSDGHLMMSDDAIRSVMTYLIPQAMLLTLRCRDAERMLGMQITTDDDMKEAARRFCNIGAQWVLLRGGQHTKGRLTALLFSQGYEQYFASYNTDGWQQRGVSGALSAAITTRIGMGDDVPTAVRNAHDYIHAQVVYVNNTADYSRRPIDLYNAFVSLVAEHYTDAHDVLYYANLLCITTRYLSLITDRVVGKSPKQIIADYVVSQAKTLLTNTRLTTKEIAFKLGFSSATTFCKFFKNNTGTSPAEYREGM